MTNGQEVDRPAQQATTVLRLLQQPATKQELARALHGTGIAVDYFLRIVQTDVRRSPGLQKCSPESFMGALLTSAQLGLRVGILPAGGFSVPHRPLHPLCCGLSGIGRRAGTGASVARDLNRERASHALVLGRDRG